MKECALASPQGTAPPPMQCRIGDVIVKDDWCAPEESDLSLHWGLVGNIFVIAKLAKEGDIGQFPLANNWWLGYLTQIFNAKVLGWTNDYGVGLVIQWDLLTCAYSSICIQMGLANLWMLWVFFSKLTNYSATWLTIVGAQSQGQN